ncbi:hypothetical protein ABVK25_009469 [Lepraria finkii]|uniref:Uncharacterized protein n=1 Tax=Lepraria finkii TaxID=1340010 RepID=A0ABR4AX45_9LECA
MDRDPQGSYSQRDQREVDLQAIRLTPESLTARDTKLQPIQPIRHNNGEGGQSTYGSTYNGGYESPRDQYVVVPIGLEIRYRRPIHHALPLPGHLFSNDTTTPV